MSASEARYDAFAITLHWLVALLVIAQFAWGWWMLDIPKQPPGPRADAFNLHKSFGMTIFALMLVRGAWRLGHSPPPLPAMPRWQAIAAKINHGLLYAALLLLPLVGYLGSVASGYPVKYFGIVLPAWGSKNEVIKSALSLAHLALSWVLAAAVLLHIAAAMKHALIDGDGLILRMWPRGRAGGRAAEQMGAEP